MKRIIVEDDWDHSLTDQARFVLNMIPDRYVMVVVANAAGERLYWDFFSQGRDKHKARITVKATMREMENTEFRVKILKVVDETFDLYWKDNVDMGDEIRARVAKAMSAEERF